MTLLLERHVRDHGHGSTQGRYAVEPRELRRCVRSKLQEELPVGDGSNTTTSCISANFDGRNNDMTTVERQEMRRDIISETDNFNGCLCTHTNAFSGHCIFHLGLLQNNQTILDKCFPDGGETGVLSHEATNTEFVCVLRRTKRIRCIQKEPGATRHTRFQNILGCLSDGIKNLACPTTTAAPLLSTTTTPASVQARVVVFVMAIVISLILGILGTGLGIFCWRRKRRMKRLENSQLPPLMSRVEHRSQPNLYDEDQTEENIYDDVKMNEDSPTYHPIPDLLNRVPSLPPMRPPREGLNVDVSKQKAGFKTSDGKEQYEPLIRTQTRNPSDETDPKTPVTSEDYLPLLPDRDSKEVDPKKTRVHPYDDINEALVEDDHVTTPKAVADGNGRPKNEYFILEPTARKLPPTPDMSPTHSSSNACPGNVGEVTPNLDSQPLSLKYIDSLSTDRGSMQTTPKRLHDDDVFKDENEDSARGDSYPDWDGYEIPVVSPPKEQETPDFDIASSFKRGEGSRISVGGERPTDDTVDV